eukprot:21739_1
MSYQDTDTEVACLIVTYSPYGPYRGLTYNAHPMRSNSHIPFHKARIFSFHHLHAILSDNITQILISYSFPQYLHLYSLSFFPIFCFFVGKPCVTISLGRSGRFLIHLISSNVC